MGDIKSSDFVHLHNHTHYSLLDGLQKIEPMLERAKELGMDAIAITDHGTLSGAVEFYKKAKERNIKPIIGIETYVATRLHTDKEPEKDKARYHLTLLAMNNEGYENLMRLASISALEGFYHRPRVDRELLRQYNEGIIVLSGCISSEIGDAFRNNQNQEAETIAKWYKDIFGDRYYLETQDHGHQWREQDKVNRKIIALGAKLKIPIVVTADAHYLYPGDREAHEILLCVQTGSFFSDQDRMTLKNTDLYLSEPKDVIERWQSHPEIIKNSKNIADRCNVDIKLGNILIPKFDTPKRETEKSYLHKLVYQGLVRRYCNISENIAKNLSITQAKTKLKKDIVERAQFELEVINRMNFDGYFLIVADFINWGKNRGIVFGPGRGSGAGSIIAYALRITDLDPLQYGLLFERFLNPDRISMPDFDIDIQDNRRDEVIQYCVKKYGQERVAHIATFGTMAARNAVRDVARVLEVPYAEADRLAKMVPPPVQGRHIPLGTSVKNNPDLRAEYLQNEQAKQVIDLAIKLEGTIRSHGVHAAGVVIAPDEIVKYAPLEMAQKGVVATQYSMGPIEDIGLLKMDFLGLSNLTIIKNTLRIVSKVWNKDINILKIPLDDTKTYKLLGNGDTTGVFQLESAGMKRYLKQLRPTVFDDIIAMVALYRPGPMQFIDDFIDRKHGRKQIEYMHPQMKSALETSYGVLVYQEQVMQIAKDLCGFSAGQADTLRKAIGKKIAELLAKMKDSFIEGGIKHSGADRSFMEKFWKQLEDFAAYCFNKSHAACYALIAYQTAYLKAYYPAAFMAALMTSNYDDIDKLARDINECQRLGIDVLPPNVNESFVEFAVTPDKKQIRFGMAAIKNVGTGAVEEILRAREGNSFISIEDFVKRVNPRVINRKVWESLIKAGAFDEFEDRDKLLFNLDTIIAYGAKTHKEAASGQTDLFDGATDSITHPTLKLDKPPTKTSEHERLQWERELLGLYLSHHPLEDYRDFLREQTMPINKLTTDMDGAQAVVGGVIQTFREVTTRNGHKMAFVSLEDTTGELELIIFPGSYKDNPSLWRQDNVIIARGKLNTKDREGRAGYELKLLVDSAEEIDRKQAKHYQLTGEKQKLPTKIHSLNPTLYGGSKTDQTDKTDTRRLFVHVKDIGDHQRLKELKRILGNYPGSTETVLVLGEDGDKSAVRLPFKTDKSRELIKKIAEIFDEKSIAVK